MPLLIAASRPRKHSQRPVTTTGILIAMGGAEWMAALVLLRGRCPHQGCKVYTVYSSAVIEVGTIEAFFGTMVKMPELSAMSIERDQ